MNAPTTRRAALAALVLTAATTLSTPAGPATTGTIPRAAPTELPDGIHPRGGGEILFKGGDAYLKVRSENGDVQHTVGTFTMPDLEWEHGYLSQGVRRLLEQEDYATELGLTDDQRRRLQALPSAPPARWPTADRDRFIAQYTAWASAAGDAKVTAGVELVGALRTYSEQKRAADQKRMTTRIEQAKAILTPAQLNKINPEPKSQPAAKP